MLDEELLIEIFLSFWGDDGITMSTKDIISGMIGKLMKVATIVFEQDKYTIKNWKGGFRTSISI